MSINPDYTVPAMTTPQQETQHLCDAVSIRCEITGPNGDWC